MAAQLPAGLRNNLAFFGSDRFGLTYLRVPPCVHIERRNTEQGSTMNSWEFSSWRCSLGWTQREAAEKLHVGTRAVEHWEQGTRRISARVEQQCEFLELRRKLWTKRGENYNPARDTVSTPQEFFDRLHREFRFVLDAAANAQNAKCRRYISPERDALTQKWRGRAVWVNPPYNQGNLERWVEHAREQTLNGAAQIVVLCIPVRSANQWWNRIVMKHAAEVRFVEGTFKYEAQADRKSAHFWNRNCIVVFRRGHTGPPVYSSMPARGNGERLAVKSEEPPGGPRTVCQ
jgi:phage N-6-adenine-methyltransferase